MVVGALASTLAIAACSEEGEPAIQCESIQFQSTRAALLSDSQTVVVTAYGSTLQIARQCTFDCGPGDLEVVEDIQLGVQLAQIMVTGNGDTLLYTTTGSGGNLRRISLEGLTSGDRPQAQQIDTHETAATLVGSMRSGDRVILRHGVQPGIDRGRLGTYRVRADDEGQPTVIEDLAIPSKLRGALDVLALGDQYIVLRRIKSAKEHVLYAMDVSKKGAPLVKLGTGKFNRVAITRRADSDGRHHDVHVVATSGHGEGAETAVFDVKSGEMVDRFAGAVVTSAVPLEDIPGLDPVSPGASHLAYVTPAGSVALRDLDANGSCVVAPNSTGPAGIAGFGNDGTLYFEKREGRTGGRTIDRVFAYDAETRETTALGEPEQDQNLRAVPPARAALPDGTTVPWALAARGGLIALHGSRAESTPLPFAADSVSFLPRVDPDGGLWLMNTVETDASGEESELRLRRIIPDFEPGFESGAPGLPASEDLELIETTPLTSGGASFPNQSAVLSTSQICMTAPKLGSWSTPCAEVRDTKAYTRYGLPASERDGEGITRD